MLTFDKSWVISIKLMSIIHLSLVDKKMYLCIKIRYFEGYLQNSVIFVHARGTTRVVALGSNYFS